MPPRDRRVHGPARADARVRGLGGGPSPASPLPSPIDEAEDLVGMHVENQIMIGLLIESQKMIGLKIENPVMVGLTIENQLAY